MAGMLGETPLTTPVTPAAAAGGLFQPQVDEASPSDGAELMETGMPAGATTRVAPDPLSKGFYNFFVNFSLWIRRSPPCNFVSPVTN